MIKDLVAGFQKAKQQYSLILQDNYELKEGIYIRLNANQCWEEQSSKFDQNHLIIRAKEDPPQNLELLEWFKRQDYHSSLVDMNKSIDPKKQVHSNNPYALFVKRDVFLGEKKDAKYTMAENIERYLLATQADQVKQKWLELIPNANRYSNKGNENKGLKQSDGVSDKLVYFHKTEYADVLKYLEDPNRQQWIERIAVWYLTQITSLTEFIRQQSFKNYVKLFFMLDSPKISESSSSDQMYAYEYDLYTVPKIYNSNDYNQIVDNELVGLPSFDMTMNSKKPYLEHKTMRVQAPDRVPLPQALTAKEMTEWLAVSQPKYTTNRLGYESDFVPNGNSPIEGTFHVYMDGKYNELHSFENVPFPRTTSFHVEWHNVLQLKERNYGIIQDAEFLQKTISGKFFRGRMNGQFVLNDPPDVKTKEFTAVMVALFLQSRQGFHDWFYKGTTLSLRSIFARVTLRLLEEQLIYVESSRLTDLADAFNLRLSIEILLNQGEGLIMADRIKNIMASVREKLMDEGVVVCSNDEEFYFIAGQLAYYLTRQSKSEKKTGDMFEPFLRARNGQQLKKRMEEAYMLYKHEISANFKKFNQLFSMLMGYVPEAGNEGNSRELLLAGLFADNLLFEKSIKGAE